MLATEALPKAEIEQLRGTQFVADKGGNIHFEILVAETMNHLVAMTRISL
jgi:hypothetical protein